jgi:hypothetical protein
MTTKSTTSTNKPTKDVSIHSGFGGADQLALGGSLARFAQP